MIELTVHEARTYFIGPDRELARMFKALRVKNKNAYWAARFLIQKYAYLGEEKIEQIKRDSAYTRFYNRRDDSFATGLLPRVLRRLRRKKVGVKVEDRRGPIQTSGKRFQGVRFLDDVEVRDEQTRLIRAALESGTGILHAATNFGKTEVACAIVESFHSQLREEPRTLFLVHRAGLAEQTMARFKKHLGDKGITSLGSGQKDIPKDAKIIVATTQTASILFERHDPDFIRFLETCQILFIDEFHVNKAWALSRVVDKCKARMRFGLSGTIDKKNKTKLLHYEGMTGPIIGEVRNEELVRLGRSAKPFIRLIEVNAPRENWKTFAEAYRESLTHHPLRNKLVIREVLRHVKMDRQTLVTVSRIGHGINLERELKSRMEVPVAFIRGNTPLYVRKKIIEDFEAGKISVLIASPIFDVGMDVPAIQAWVNAAGGKGWELVLQRLGRVLRKKKKGRNCVYISDFIDKHNKYLMKHSMARFRYYQNEKIAKISIID